LKRKIESKKKTDEHRRGKTKQKKKTGDRSKKSTGKIKNKKKTKLKKLCVVRYIILKMKIRFIFF
jgi:hypothetical protein